ncbi:hypothetical protein H696_00146 [Fonticula alba]|uniref:Uncharacterized protein n=1 Tax=Fonticula alba TaxID=691883 RepID=A0A058ZDT3_FONAL|nr:hypothetical protein H696_00146 [Fonticula alba]KCV72555.1 hypothetical protein H696_00146 [Fonticula alba]|eukprot:XP_009492256.1 hypothetical protein H696_00146 [Fonticula alba]
MYDAVCFPFGAALSVAKFLISAFVLVYLFATYNWLGRLIAASLPTSGRGGSASGFTDNMRSIGRKRRLINELISVSVVHLILPIFITVCRIGLVPWFAGHAIEVVQELLFFGVTLFTETSRRVREMSAALRSEDGSGDGADERQPRLTPEQIHASAVAAVAALEQQRQATAPAPPGAASEAPPSGPSVDHAAEDAADDIAGAEADTILAHGLRQLLGESAAEMPGPAPTEPMATSPTAAMDLVFAGGSDAGRPQLQPYELSSDSASTSFSSSHTLLSDT